MSKRTIVVSYRGRTHKVRYAKEEDDVNTLGQLRRSVTKKFGLKKVALLHRKKRPVKTTKELEKLLKKLEKGKNLHLTAAKLVDVATKGDAAKKIRLLAKVAGERDRSAPAVSSKVIVMKTFSIFSINF